MFRTLIFALTVKNCTECGYCVRFQRALGPVALQASRRRELARAFSAAGTQCDGADDAGQSRCGTRAPMAAGRNSERVRVRPGCCVCLLLAIVVAACTSARAFASATAGAAPGNVHTDLLHVGESPTCQLSPIYKCLSICMPNLTCYANPILKQFK